MPDQIVLRIRRSQTQGMMGKVTFAIDARAEVSAADAALISKYRLGDMVVYDSAARRERTSQASDHFDTAALSGRAVSTGAGAWALMKGAAVATLASFSLRVTINGLIKGQHIAAKDLPELMSAEAAIVEACQSLKMFLDTAVGFDGREELIEI